MQVALHMMKVPIGSEDLKALDQSSSMQRAAVEVRQGNIPLRRVLLRKAECGRATERAEGCLSNRPQEAPGLAGGLTPRQGGVSNTIQSLQTRTYLG